MDLKIAAAYVRVSTDDQLEYSPDSQLKIIQEHAKRDGYYIPDEYVFREEDGISGKSADKRPKFRLMIAMAKENPSPFSAIFVWKFSRFARNQEEAITYKNLLKKKGVTVKSVSEPMTDDPFSTLIERIIEWMDEYYLINLAGEVRRGMTEKAARGECVGAAPFGYKVQDKILVPDEDAETVRYIFRAKLAGMGDRTIAQQLGEKGVRTRRGNLPDNRWVRYILQNPVYIGKVRYSKEGHVNYSRSGSRDENAVLYDGQHEAIVSQEVFDEVQEIYKRGTPEPRYIRKSSEGTVFALRGVLRCSSCGATLTMQSNKYKTVQCYNYARGSCHDPHGIKIDTITESVIEGLEQIVRDRSFVFAPKVPQGGVPAEWDKLIAAEEKKLERARTALLDGVFSSAEYNDVKTAINAQIEALRGAQTAEVQKTVDLDDYAERVLSVIEVLRSPDVSELAKNAAIVSVIDKIVFDKAAGRLDFYFREL